MSHPRNGKPPLAAPHTTPAEKKWSQVLEEWRPTGLDGAAFCRERGLSVSAFRYWKQEIARRQRRRQAQRAAAEASRNAMRLVPVRLLEPTTGGPAPAPVEIVLRGGRVVRIGSDFDPAMLEKLVGTLEAIR